MLDSRRCVTQGVVGLCLGMVGCFDRGPNFKLDFCEAKFFPGECVSASHPFKFLDEHERYLATGGVTPVRYLALDNLAAELRSSDPAILQIETDIGSGLVQHGLKEGTVTLEAIDPEGRVLDHVAVEVARIDTVRFAFGPGTSAPVDRLAALPGTTERIQILPMAADGELLAGAEPRIAFAFTGGLSAADINRAEIRIGRFEFTTPGRAYGFATAVRFDSVGAATMTASVDGVVRGSLPIDVIQAAEQVSIDLAEPTMVTQYIQVAALRGTDSRGVPVAGLIADFTAAPTELATISDPHGGEALIATLAPGVVTVTAKLPDRSLTTQFTIVPR